MINPIKLKIVGEKTMGCSGCEGNVEFSISQIAGVDEVRADRTSQMVEVYLKTDVPFESIREEMGELGYMVETI